MIALQRYAPSCCGPRSYGDIIHGAVARSKGGPKTARIRSSRGRPLLLLGTVDGHADAVDAEAVHGQHGERHLACRGPQAPPRRPPWGCGRTATAEGRRRSRTSLASSGSKPMQLHQIVDGHACRRSGRCRRAAPRCRRRSSCAYSSSMRPTICSMMSLMVTMPAVPPCSSTTTRDLRCDPPAWPAAASRWARPRARPGSAAARVFQSLMGASLGIVYEVLRVHEADDAVLRAVGTPGSACTCTARTTSPGSLPACLPDRGR